MGWSAPHHSRGLEGQNACAAGSWVLSCMHDKLAVIRINFVVFSSE